MATIPLPISPLPQMKTREVSTRSHHSPPTSRLPELSRSKPTDAFAGRATGGHRNRPSMGATGGSFGSFFLSHTEPQPLIQVFQSNQCQDLSWISPQRRGVAVAAIHSQVHGRGASEEFQLRIPSRLGIVSSHPQCRDPRSRIQNPSSKNPKLRRREEERFWVWKVWNGLTYPNFKQNYRSGASMTLLPQFWLPLILDSFDARETWERISSSRNIKIDGQTFVLGLFMESRLHTFTNDMTILLRWLMMTYDNDDSNIRP